MKEKTHHDSKLNETPCSHVRTHQLETVLSHAVDKFILKEQKRSLNDTRIKMRKNA